MKNEPLIAQPNRLGTKREGHETLELPSLNKIDWNVVLSQAPKCVKISHWDRLKSQLPSADYIILTWTEAEWNALDFVFCDSNCDMPYYRSTNKNQWKDKWLSYSLGYEEARKKYNIPPHAPSCEADAWGRICMSDVNGRNVL